MTEGTKASQITRSWHHVDVNDKVLGRIATDIAKLLMGKNKAYFVRNLDCGDYVIVTNAKNIKVTGKKEKLKTYYRHSGYPGGFKAERLEELRGRCPEEIIRHAVSGMLPQNRLRDQMLKRLKVFADGEHPYEEKIKSQNAEVKSTS